MSPPFGIKLYSFLPLPYRKGTDSILTSLTGGGERAPVALFREPTDAAAETRGWVYESSQN